MIEERELKCALGGSDKILEVASFALNPMPEPDTKITLVVHRGFTEIFVGYAVLHPSEEYYIVETDVECYLTDEVTVSLPDGVLIFNVGTWVP